MERILIVEDNKALARLISKKITLELDFKVDMAFNLQEAKLFLKKFTYFVTLLDLNLPDAPNGEVVDYALKKNNRVIILSGNIDKKFRKKMLKKRILDYINKGGIDDINYIIYTLSRLKKNQEHKILVVDDSRVFRDEMKNMLENLFFNVYTVAHGEEALGMLDTNSDISLVLVDYYMPVMDGLELTREIRKKYNKNDLNIIALSSNEEEEINALFLKQGANDYIKKPFSKEEFSCRINNSIEALENIQIITNHANRDFLTGLYNRRYFFNNMETYFAESIEHNEKFAIAMVDIDFFKKINDTYGHESGDKVIVVLSEILRTNTNQNDMVARFGGEEFCVVLKDIAGKNVEDIFDRIRLIVQKTAVLSDNNEKINFTISIGIVTHHEDTLSESINNADMMLYNAKQEGRNTIVIE